MSESDLHRLTAAPPDRSLDRLEDDVWRGIRRAADDRIVRVAGVVQVGVLALVLIGSVTAGASFAMERSSQQRLAELVPGLQMTPSALLLGPAR